MREQPSAMQTLRQLYVYAVTAATLVFIAIGAVNLLGLGLDRVFTAVSGEGWIQDGPDWERERLSLFLPFIVIATPIWWLHWRMAQRAVRGDDATAERRSPVRNLFFALVFIVTGLQLLLVSLQSLVEFAMSGALGRSLQDFERNSIVTSLAILIVSAAVWTFHLRAYLADVREETTETRSALPVPVVLYLASAFALIMFTFGARDLIGVAVDAVAGEHGIGRWWREPLAMGAATLATGAVIWALNWPLTERLRRGSAWWGRGRAGATLRGDRPYGRPVNRVGAVPRNASPAGDDAEGLSARQPANPASWAALPEPVREAILAVPGDTGKRAFDDYAEFETAFVSAAKRRGVKVTAKLKKDVRGAVAVRDETAKPIVRKQTSDTVEYEPDPELRDTEQIPLTEPGGIAGFIEREVLPYVPDAWVVEGSERIGCEISFTRYFYKPQQLRTLAEIEVDIRALEAETEGLLEEILVETEPVSVLERS